MFGPITIPFGSKMLFNTVTLKPGVNFDQVEMAVGEMCMVVKQTYGGEKGGFIAGQVFKFSGFVSDEGLSMPPGRPMITMSLSPIGPRLKITKNPMPTKFSTRNSLPCRVCALRRKNSVTTCCGKAQPILNQPSHLRLCSCVAGQRVAMRKF